MATSFVESESLLAIDVGTVTTRAAMFDVVENQYRYIGAGEAPTTAGAPFHHLAEGVRLAIDHLQHITGRRLIGANEELILPSTADGAGADTFAATLSAGGPLRVVLVGLLESASLESAKRLAETVPSIILQKIYLTDRRGQDGRLDAILHARPELIIISGGTEKGASRSVLKMIEAVSLACYLMPEDQRPLILFVGNQALHEEVKARLGEIAPLKFAPNIRPRLDVERLNEAMPALAEVYVQLRSQKIPGVSELNHWARGQILPSPSAFGRIVRFLSKAQGGEKGVLGVDVGGGSTNIALAKEGELCLRVYPELGVSEIDINLLGEKLLPEILFWLHSGLSASEVREYLYNRSLQPIAIPYSPEELAVEYAILRVILRHAMQRFLRENPLRSMHAAEARLPWVEPVIISGRLATSNSDLPRLTLALLDGLQPEGLTTLILDNNMIMPALGAAASLNPLLSVQVLNSNAFLHLGTIIAPVGKARWGSPALRIKMTYDSGREIKREIKMGSLEMVPLPRGQSAKLQLQPLNKLDIGMGAPGRGGSVRVVGGAFGVIVDARGRPMGFPKEIKSRKEMAQQWLWNLGGE